jgi:hypothetical protein
LILNDPNEYVKDILKRFRPKFVAKV